MLKGVPKRKYDGLGKDEVVSKMRQSYWDCHLGVTRFLGFAFVVLMCSCVLIGMFRFFVFF